MWANIIKSACVEEYPKSWDEKLSIDFFFILMRHGNDLFKIKRDL